MILNDFEFLSFAYKKYTNPKNISLKEFEADVKRFSHLNALLNRYREDRFDLKDRLIVNHIVILTNCFGVSGTLNMLDYKVPEKNKTILDTFLVFMGLVDTADIDIYLFDILESS